MALRYGLVPNPLTNNGNDYMGVVTENETITTKQIVDQMIGKGSTVTKAEALSVIEEFSYAVAEAIGNGHNINTELFKIYPSVRGVFEDENDSFDSSRHTIRLNLNAGSRLAEMVSNIDLRKVEITSPHPVLQKFTDLKSNVVNERCTPGQIASIKGSLLKYNEDDEMQGIFFIAPDGSETKVMQVVKNKPSELLFFVPDSLAGTYSVEVRVIPHNNKNIRKGRLEVDISVTV